MKKIFKVKINENLSKTIIICAENFVEAYEKAEELCNNSTVNLDAKNFDNRKIECNELSDNVTISELEKYEIYD